MTDDTDRFEQWHQVFTAGQVHLYVQQQLTDYPGLANNSQMKLRVLQDVADGMVAQIVTWCVAGRVPDCVTHRMIEYPDGVWQMFKQKFMPRWLTRRFPVKNVQIKVVEQVSHYFVCPHLVTDAQNRHVQFMATGSRMAPWFGERR